MKGQPRICAIFVIGVLAAGHCGPAATAQLAAPQPQRKEKAIGLLNQAIEIAHSEPDPIGKASALMLIADPLASIGETDRAAQLLAEADRLMQPVEGLGDGLSKNLIMFPLAAKYVAAGRFDRAEAMLDRILNEYEEMAASLEDEWRGRAADHRAEWLVKFAPLYVILGRRQKVKDLIAANHERLKKISHWLYRDRGLGRTAMAYAVLGERERAVEIAQTVKPGRSGDEAWVMIAVAYAQAGDLDKASDLIQSRGDGEFFDASYFLWIAKRFLEHGRKDKAVAIIQKLASRYESKDTQLKASYGEIAMGWALVGEFEKALRTSKQVVSHAEQMRTLTGLSQIFFKAGRAKEANRLALKASKLTGFSKGSYFEARDLKEVAETYAATGLKEEAAKLLSLALGVLAKSHDGVEDMIRADIAVSYASMGMDDDAISAAQAITDKADQARALAAIASMQLGIKSHDERWQLFGPLKLP